MGARRRRTREGDQGNLVSLAARFAAMEDAVTGFSAAALDGSGRGHVGQRRLGSRACRRRTRGGASAPCETGGRTRRQP